MNRFARPFRSSGEIKGPPAFTLVELLVVIAVIAILASLLGPSLASARSQGQRIACLNHVRQLTVAWMLYASDNEERLAYNLGGTEIKQMLLRHERYNWANSVLNWELDPDNTNLVLNTQAALGAYLASNGNVFRCPSDRALSQVQRAAGWRERSRSISMNAMVGDAGEFTRDGPNVNNPYYRQFLRLPDIPASSTIFVFIEEHPDSINDGYFLNRPNTSEWSDLPASHHRGGANIGFADGHVEGRHWQEASTRPPARPDGAGLPIHLEETEQTDFKWLMERTTIYRGPAY